MVLAAVNCQAWTAAAGAKFARFTVTGVDPDRAFETTMPVTALSPDRCAANTDRLSALAVESARTLVSPKVDRFPS